MCFFNNLLNNYFYCMVTAIKSYERVGKIHHNRPQTMTVYYSALKQTKTETGICESYLLALMAIVSNNPDNIPTHSTTITHQGH